jgi:ParB family chromosome partitioning protein
MLVDINKIKVSDRIRKDFGNIQELADDIKENGLINPPVVTPEYDLIAGERRLRAMKLLGYEQVEVRIMSVQDALHQLKLEISENENRKDFSFSEKMQWAEQLKAEYEKIAKANSLNNLENLSSGKHLPLGEVGRVRDKIAEDLNLGSGEQFRKAEYIKQNADEELIKALDEGQLSVNAAYKQLKEKVKELENRPEKIIDKTDYNTINQLNNKTSELETQVKYLIKEKEILERKAKLNQEDADKYNKLKNDIEFLNQQKSDLARQLKSATELAELTVKLQHVLENDLAPIKYKRCMDELNNSDVAVENLQSIINSLSDWMNEIKKYMPTYKNNNVEIKGVVIND